MSCASPKNECQTAREPQVDLDSDVNERLSNKAFAISSWSMALVFFAALGACSIARVLMGNSVYDLTIYHTALLNTARGTFYFSYLYPQGALFYQHFDPIALVFVPFYLILGNAAWPVLPLSMALSGALMFPALAELGRFEHLSRKQSLIMPFVMLLNPSLHNVVWYDFHPLIFSMPLLIWGYLLILRGRIGFGSVCWLLALMCKENVALTVAGFGLTLCFRRKMRIGLSWFVFSIFWFILVTMWIIPLFREVGTGNIFLVRYSWLGNSPQEILSNLLFHPFEAIRTVWQRPMTSQWLQKIFLPFGLVSLISPTTLLAAGPESAVLLLSQFEPMQSIKFHYPAVILPVVSAASVSGLAKIYRLCTCAKKVQMRYIYNLLIFISLSMALFYSTRFLYDDGRSLPFLKQPKKRKYYVAEKRISDIRDLSGLISKGESISIPHHLLNPVYPFTEYPLIAFAPDRIALADVVILDTQLGYWGGYKEDGIQEALNALKNNVEYEKIFERKGLWAFRKNAASSDEYKSKEKSWRLNSSL